jgi:hypothetical protein
VIVQTEEKNQMWVHFEKPEEPDPTRFALTSPSELWKLKPSEIIAVNDPVIGNYTLTVSANLVAETSEGLAVVEYRLPTKVFLPGSQKRLERRGEPQ